VYGLVLKCVCVGAVMCMTSLFNSQTKTNRGKGGQAIITYSFRMYVTVDSVMHNISTL
jgi:hypothetical protein